MWNQFGIGFPALSGSADGFFNKVDTSLDQFIARYAEHVFRDAPVKVLDRRISRSWKILGQGVITSLVDLLLFNLMCVVLPFRFLLLLVLTPIGLLTERSRQQREIAEQLESKQGISFPQALPGDLPRSLVSSVTDHTTRNLHNLGRLDDTPEFSDRTAMVGIKYSFESSDEIHSFEMVLVEGTQGRLGANLTTRVCIVNVVNWRVANLSGTGLRAMCK